jgi:hypothetical protein
MEINSIANNALILIATITCVVIFIKAPRIIDWWINVMFGDSPYYANGKNVRVLALIRFILLSGLRMMSAVIGITCAIQIWDFVKTQLN